MKPWHRIWHRQTIKTFLLCGATWALAGAQEFYWNTVSARSMALGGVYIPSSDGVIDALATNPAGLTGLTGPSLNASVSGVFARGSFQNTLNRDAQLNDTPGVIPSLAFGMPIGKSRFSFGVGVTPELLSVANWKYVDAPGVAGASYGLQQQKSAIVAEQANVGLGFTLTKSVALGFTAGAVYNSNTLDAPYIFQSNPALAGLKTLLNLHTTGFGWNAGAGLIARPTNRVTLNLAWKSRTVIDSTGSARGNLSQQFAALGLAAPSSFGYSAMVQSVLPQSVLAGVNWRVDGRWIFGVQGNWLNWSNSFHTLPVMLTNGTNPAINGLLGSNSILDRVPVLWKDQFSIHAGAERLLTENVSLRGGYAHYTNPVPASTLTPLTAAIMTDQFTAGLVYRHRRVRFDLAYGVTPLGSESVGKSGLLNGEYSNSIVRVGTQALTLETSMRF